MLKGRYERELLLNVELPMMIREGFHALPYMTELLKNQLSVCLPINLDATSISLMSETDGV